VEVEAVELGLAWPARGGVTQVWLVAEAADTSASAGAQGDAALDGGADEAGEDRRDFCERVRRRRIVDGLQLAAGEQSPHACADGGGDLCDVLFAWRRRGVKGQAAWRRVAEDAVEHERVEVDIEFEAAPKALDHRRRAGLALPDAVRPRGAHVEGEQPEAHDRAAQGVRDPRPGGSAGDSSVKTHWRTGTRGSTAYAGPHAIVDPQLVVSQIDD
jgi:hypothetical protein